MSANAPQQSASESSGGWLALTATQLGASHRAAGLTNQDAVATAQIRPAGLVAAVADGHGHHRHFRSARGSELAVAVACEAAQELTDRLDRLDRLEAAGQIEAEARRTLVPAIAQRWRARVREDLAAKPFTVAEEERRAASDDALIAYGSTLLLAIAWRKWLIMAQIGDGDIVGIQPDGQALLPVPGDPSLDGRQTTSLCGPRAEQEFRIAVVDTSRTPLLGLLLASDGYGNAQVADPWPEAVSADLAELIGSRPPEWLADQLPSWASRCASADGSADDTTIALLILPSAAARRQAESTVPATVELPAAAARRLAESTVPVPGKTRAWREGRLAKSAVSAPVEPPVAVAGKPAAPPPTSAGWPRRFVLIAALAVLVAVAAVLVVIRLRASSATAPAACRAPTATVGRPVTGRATTACDTSTGRDVRISMSGLPTGGRIALQAGGSIFVLVGNTLRWRPITGHGLKWDNLGTVPAGAQQALCLSRHSVIVVASEAATAAVGKPASSWTDVSTPEKSPVKVGPPDHVASDVCAERRGR
jgi:serine/threonine protein phosphatase PrpC